MGGSYYMDGGVGGCYVEDFTTLKGFEGGGKS